MDLHHKQSVGILLVHRQENMPNVKQYLSLKIHDERNGSKIEEERKDFNAVGSFFFPLIFFLLKD